MKAKNILFIHGWEASPHEHWFPKAKEKFEKAGYKVYIPEMPGNYFPKKEKWLEIVGNLHPDKNWILIGHSLGGVTVLKYLENAQKPIAQAILIAAPFDAMKFGAIENFFARPPSLRSGDSRRAGGYDWEKIKENCPKFDIVNEDADPAVPLEHGEKFAKNLNGKLHVVRGFTHFHDIDLELLEGLIK
jgi:predicted alpha/beta hydrolase family esterase